MSHSVRHSCQQDPEWTESILQLEYIQTMTYRGLKACTKRALAIVNAFLTLHESAYAPVVISVTCTTVSIVANLSRIQYCTRYCEEGTKVVPLHPCKVR